MYSKHTQFKNCILLLMVVWSPISLLANQNDTGQLSTLALPAITFEDGIHTIFDSQLQEHAFRQRDEGPFTAISQSSGTLRILSNGVYQWVDDSERIHYLTGSQTLEKGTEKSSGNRTKQSSATRSVQTGVTGMNPVSSGAEFDKPMRYSGNNLQRSPLECQPSDSDTPDKDSDTSAEVLGNSSEPETPETPETTDESDEIDAPDESEQCDTSSKGPHTFESSPFSGPNTPLDARPASCQSYFVQYYGTDRGFEIEAGLHLHAPYSGMEATLRTFPVIDFIDEERLYVVHSRDLGNRTFNSPSRPDALLKQLLKDGEEIQTRFFDVLDTDGSISASELGQSTTISADQLKPVTLQLVVRDGIASASHWQQIETARKELMERHGIILEVVVIP